MKGRCGVPRAMVEIGRTATVEELEGLLVKLQGLWEAEKRPSALASVQAVARLAGRSEGGFFSELWAAIVVGTFCRRWENGTVAAWGLQSWPNDIRQSSFAMSLAGLTAIQVAIRTVTDSVHPITLLPEIVRKVISFDGEGILEPDSGSSRTLVEFDPEAPVALAVRDKKRPGVPADLRDEHRLFEQLILKFRAVLEIGATRLKIEPVASGSAGALGQFLVELRDNGLEHGTRGAERRSLRGVRFLRLRKHVAPSREALLGRAQAFPELRAYLEQMLLDRGTQAVVEASVSDFGLGIVDNFLGSPIGRVHAGQNRRELLDQLLLERLSAKGADPAAGLGIRRALEAARHMQAFVSLRTAEFWLHRSYADLGVQLGLTDVHRVAPLGKAAGTHWQFIWPQPLI